MDVNFLASYFPAFYNLSNYAKTYCTTEEKIRNIIILLSYPSLSCYAINFYQDTTVMCVTTQLIFLTPVQSIITVVSVPIVSLFGSLHAGGFKDVHVQMCRAVTTK